MKKCPFCGEMNNDQAVFCGECGKSLQQIPPQRPVHETSAGQGNTQGYTNPRGPIQQGYQGQGGRQRPQYNRPRGLKLTKNLKIILVQVLVLIVGIIAFSAVGSSMSSPEKAAERYFHALVERDTETLHEMTVMSESPFLTVEAMDLLVQELNLEEADQLAQVEVQMEEERYSGYGGFGSFSDSDKSSSFVKNAYIQYRWKNEDRAEAIELTLIEGDGSVMFFFPNWKVKDENFVAKDFQIEVPAGSQLVVDGLEVPDFYVEESDDYTDIYVIDIFRGEHEMVVLTEGLPPQTYEFEAWSGDYIYAADFELDQNAKTSLENAMKDTMNRYYEAALSRADASVLADLWSISNGEDLKNKYQQFVNWMFEDSDVWVTKIDITAFETRNCYTYESDGKIYAELSIGYDYTYEYAETAQGAYVTGTYTDSDWNSMDARFYLKDGKWVLDYFWIPDYL